MIPGILECSIVALLIVGAACDIRLFRLPNWLTAATALLALAFLIAAATPVPDILFHLGFGAAVLLVGLLLFRFNILGGGDVKWLAALAIWIGPHLDFMRFIFLIGLAGGALAVVVFLATRIWRSYGREAGRIHLPYGVAIAIAGLDYWLRHGLIRP